MELILLFGGPSRERLVSVATAQNIAANLNIEAFAYWNALGQVCIVNRSELISFKDPFRQEFQPISVIKEWNSIKDFCEQCKLEGACIFNACHGGDGENGELATLLESLQVPFTGSGSKACALAFDKMAAKNIASAVGISVPQGTVIDGPLEERTRRISRSLQQFSQIVLKPLADGSSFGLHFVTNSLPASLQIPVEEVYLAEERIFGREMTVAVADVGNGPTAFPVVEIACAQDSVFDYGNKYLGGAKEICPAQVDIATSAKLQEAALAVHKAIGAYGYSRTDFILGENDVTFLEINTLPGLTKASLLPLALSTAGIPMSQFLMQQVHLAKRRV